MVQVEANENQDENLVDELSLDRLPSKGPKRGRLKRVVEPHLRPHKSNGKLYYYYCRGAYQEIYLGDADTILKAVRAYKIASAKKGP